MLAITQPCPNCRVVTCTDHCVVLCSDDNECLTPGICGQAKCENTIGSYTCGCGGGGVFDANMRICVGK